MGIILDQKDVLGVEAAGVVARVGAAVTNVKQGDRVAIFGKGLFVTKKVVPANCVMPIPDDLTFEEAATIPAVYATAAYALIYLGQLARGQVSLEAKIKEGREVE